mmetsp:Transcript_29021/g.57917  ORF Transcript_29021/g.57917 Transcript_29021/m.57917 type:complete len:284 (+) Transcript_29021:34-885(+)
MEIKSKVKVCGGELIRFTHQSNETKTPMTCAVFIPNTASSTPTPYLLYLSGLTCTDENVCQKSGVFQALAKHQIAFVAPDTSPRGAGIEGEDDGWDFGTGAGFYLDATSPKWADNYRMYSYVTKELPSILTTHFPQLDQTRVSITGHSMGGHGALTIALKNPTKYRSVSAFSPICNPSNCPWGHKAFGGYLMSREEWSEYDATELMASRTDANKAYDDILIDVGTADSFLTGGQLLPEAFKAAADKVGQKVSLRLQEGYDHSYFFISSFITDHVEHHAQRLKA